MKFLITGGSGFIGTNLISYLLKNDVADILNVDYQKPNLAEHNTFWENVDIRNSERLKEVVVSYQPDIVIHLAARTDLNGKSLEDYSTNTVGVKNLLQALNEVKTLKRAVFTSSMYVCYPGYMPKNFEDYAPHTLYGESKVETEKIVKSANLSYTWSIIRPTSIWGPWFSEPYSNFFRVVLSRMYFHLGKRACTKTYGYIDNTIYQIISILNAPAGVVNKNVYYLGDYEPYNITEWANEIADSAGFKIPTIPYFFFQIAGWGGDLLKICGVKFPLMTSFRLKNMTTNNVHDLSPIQKIAQNLPESRKEGTRITIGWLKSNK